MSETVPETLHDSTPQIDHQAQLEEELEQIQNGPGFNRGESNNDESVDHDLPPGWIASVDPASGEEYYFNEDTGETTW